MSKVSQENQNETRAENRPSDVIRDGNLKASIWRNEGENGISYATVLARTYRTEDGAYRESNSFSGSELLRVSELARKAYDRTGELRQNDFERSAERTSGKSAESLMRSEDQAQDHSVSKGGGRGGQ
ncbi:MAG: hypothetical protein IPO55_01605 [Alphaproteobacteria bacterium]|nr:hypothetical protein [Alphaproteobacteria bacterium]